MNWNEYIQDLIDAGMTQAAIGESIGLSQPSIADLLNGHTKSVRWEVGDKLIALHKIHLEKAA